MTPQAPSAYQVLALDTVHESAWNPRKHWNVVKLKELTESVVAHGVLDPILARPDATGYEIAAGHRRYRAAKGAGLEVIPAIVREMTDAEFLEVLAFENLHHENVHPLEEAECYHQLLAKGHGYDVARIAERVNKDRTYIYDRLKLRQLIKMAQKLFLEETITLGHAVILARLTGDDQARALDPNVTGGGLFTRELVLFGPDDRPAGRAQALKPVSVREFQGWVDKHVRFNPIAADPVLFPETVGVVTAAVEAKEKVVAITHDHYIDPDAREGKTFGPRSWRRADGAAKSKACDYAVAGVIVVGPGRGDAFKVCVNKDKCATHWGAEQRDRKRRAVSGASGGAAGARLAAAQRRDQQEQQRRAAEHTRWQKATPKLLEALAEAIKKAPAGPAGPLAAIITPESRGYARGVKLDDYIGRGTTAEDVVRRAAFAYLADDAVDYYRRDAFIRAVKAFRIDVTKIVDAAAPTEKPAAPKTATAPRAAAKRKTSKRRKAA